jgi:glycerol-3-phosphate acyltransferase PlsY
MSAAISLPLVLLIMQKWFNNTTSSELLYFAIFIALLIVFTHRSNIQRILQGKENKVPLGKKKTQ